MINYKNHIMYTDKELDILKDMLPHYGDCILLAYNYPVWFYTHRDKFKSTISSGWNICRAKEDSVFFNWKFTEFTIVKKMRSYPYDERLSDSTIFDVIYYQSLEDMPLYFSTPYEVYAQWRLEIGR